MLLKQFELSLANIQTANRLPALLFDYKKCCFLIGMLYCVLGFVIVLQD